MGRNAAFGRPPASERFRMWWDARSKTSRQNALLAVVVGGLFVAIVMAAVARDESTSTSRVISSRLHATTTLALPTPSTVNIGEPGADAGGMTAADLFGLNTTSTTPAPATTAPAQAPPPTRPPPAAATTSPPAPATTVTNPGVIFTTVPPETTTTTRPPVTTTAPAPTTTTTPTTTTVLVPLTVPALVSP